MGNGFFQDEQHKVASVNPTVKHAPASKAATKKGKSDAFAEARQKAVRNEQQATVPVGRKGA